MQIHPCNTKQSMSKEKESEGQGRQRSRLTPCLTPLSNPHRLCHSCCSAQVTPTAAIRLDYSCTGGKGACMEPQANSKTLPSFKMKLLDSGKQLLPLVLNPSYTGWWRCHKLAFYSVILKACAGNMVRFQKWLLTPCPKAQTKGWQNRRKRHRHLFKALLLTGFCLTWTCLANSTD